MARAGADVVVDVQERERLLYMMAAMAAADGVVDERERKLLKLCSRRAGTCRGAAWRWRSRRGPGLFDNLMPDKQSAEAETFLRTLVKMALVDGRIDRKERRMLESVALHLGMPDKLPGLLQGR